jgi:hypothetical protein
VSISLYEASVASYIQIVPAVSALLNKAADHFSAEGTDLEELLETRLHSDMLPLRFQVLSVVHHSIDVIDAIRNGVFGPGGYDAAVSYADLQARVEAASLALAALDVDEVNALSGKPMAFVMGEMNLPFTAENFVLSFSLPNLYFHAATAYDILRQKGLPLAKRDFMGKLRIIRSPKG